MDGVISCVRSLGIHQGFRVIAEIEDEFISAEEGLSGCEPEMIQQVVSEIEEGDLFHVMTTVTAYLHDVELGSAHLGSSFIKSLDEFFDSEFHGYMPQMVEEAVSKAQEALSSMPEAQKDELVRCLDLAEAGIQTARQTLAGFRQVDGPRTSPA